MAFAIRNLSVLMYANGFTHWHYKSSSDTLQDICAPNNFNDARDIMAVNDALFLCARDGVAMVYVSHNQDGVVRVKPLEIAAAMQKVPTSDIFDDLYTGRAFGLRSAMAADNLPQAEASPLNTHTVRGIDGIADVTRCTDPVEISIGLTSTGVIPDNTVVSFSLPGALAFAYAIIAQVDAASPAVAVTERVAAKVVKIVPRCPGGSAA